MHQHAVEKGMQVVEVGGQGSEECRVFTEVGERMGRVEAQGWCGHGMLVRVADRNAQRL